MIDTSINLILTESLIGRQRARTDPLLPTSWEIWAVVSLLAFYLVADALLGESCYQSVNFGGPVALVVILSYANWHMARKDSKSVWTALFWYRVSTSVYFGLGTMFVYVADDFTRRSMESFYSFSDNEVFKLNFLVTLSVIFVLVMARFTIHATYRWATRIHQRGTVITKKNIDGLLWQAAVWCLGLGLFIDYGFVMPYSMGWTSFVLPGVVLSLKNLVPIGFFMLVLWGRQRAKWVLFVILALIAVEMLIGLLGFGKSDVLFLLIMVFLAFLWDRVTIYRLLIIGAVFAVVYSAIAPVVDYGRHELQLKYGGNTQAGLGERLEILGQYFNESAPAHETIEKESGFMRYSYVNAATLLIHRYDSGYPEDWPEVLGAVFIPRVLWPDKPIITSIGLRIYTLGTGSEGSSSGAGLVAEAYWAWGWWGVVFFMGLYGAAIGVLTRFASVIMHNSQWFYLPVVLMALRYGMRTDGHYIADAAGGLVIIVGLYILFRVIGKILR